MNAAISNYDEQEFNYRFRDQRMTCDSAESFSSFAKLGTTACQDAGAVQRNSSAAIEEDQLVRIPSADPAGPHSNRRPARPRAGCAAPERWRVADGEPTHAAVRAARIVN